MVSIRNNAQHGGETRKTNHRESHRLTKSPIAHIDSALSGPGTKPYTSGRSDLGMRTPGSGMLPTVGIVLCDAVSPS